jgi:hypothetical protein
MRIFLALLLAALAAAPGPAFVDVSRSSGVSDAVAAHLGAFPKVWLSGLTLLDVDADGDLDLHVGSHSGPAAPAALLRNDGKGGFSRVDPQMTIPRGPKARDPLPYPGGEIRLPWDIDEDGRLDLLCSWHDGGGALYLNAGEAFGRGDALDAFSRAAAIGDLDGDGLVDYLAGHDRSDRITVLLGRKGGAFEKSAPLPGLLESGAVPIDLDGDGDLDLLLSQRGYHPAKRRILRNEGGLKFSTWDAGLDEDAGSLHGAGDLNGDGRPDLIAVEGKDVAIYLNDGKGKFEAKPGAVRGLERSKNRPRYANWGGAVVTDLDNDGVADVLIGGRHFLYALRGIGGGSFEVANDAWGLPDGAWSAVDEGLCFGDVDGDGRLDLVCCAKGPEGKEKGVALFRNELPAKRWLRVRVVGAPGNRAAAGAVIRITAAGEPEKLLWTEPVAIWGRQSFHSSYAAAATERHFGLGDRDRADVAVTFPSGRRVERKDVKADATILIEEGK